METKVFYRCIRKSSNLFIENDEEEGLRKPTHEESKNLHTFTGKKVRKPSGKKIGYLCVLVQEEDEHDIEILDSGIRLFKGGVEVFIGWSLCKKGDKFDSKLGMEIALTRAERMAESTCTNSWHCPYSVEKAAKYLVRDLVRKYEKHNDKNVVMFFPSTKGMSIKTCSERLPDSPVKRGGPYKAEDLYSSIGENIGEDSIRGLVNYLAEHSGKLPDSQKELNE